MRRLPMRLALAAALLASLPASGCRTVYEGDRVRSAQLAAEGSLVFVRPDRYSLIGTRSVRDYIEITYENAERNEAGMMVVEIGLRNRGGKHWWDPKAPDLALTAKAAFYDTPPGKSGPTSPPVYTTNWQTVVIPRGDTAHYSVTCPVTDADGYQITLSELR